MNSTLNDSTAIAPRIAVETSLAQHVPANIADKLKEIGRIIETPRTADLYASLQQREPYAGIKAERDVKYGLSERNRLDIFTPEEPSSARPVLIFVHGGGFTGGDKRTSGSPFYDNVMLWAVKNGFIGVNVTYRLAPEFPWPAGPEDMATAVRWIIDNIAAHSGDPARVYLMGTSAGAVHVASYVSHPEFHGPAGSGLAGAILVSGLYDLSNMPAAESLSVYFGNDTGVYAARSSLAGLLKTATPLMIVSTELDPPIFEQQFDLLRDSLRRTERGCSHAIVLPLHNHTSPACAINTADTGLTSEILRFTRIAR